MGSRRWTNGESVPCKGINYNMVILTLKSGQMPTATEQAVSKWWKERAEHIHSLVFSGYSQHVGTKQTRRGRLLILINKVLVQIIGKTYVLYQLPNDHLWFRTAISRIT